MAGGFAFAAGVGASGVYEPVSMYFNGIKIADGIKVEDTTYIPLRTFFDVIGDQTDIAWDKKSNTVTVSGEGLEMSATAGSLYMTANNRCFYLPGSVLVIDGALCLPIRELAKIYQLEVDWDEELSSVILWADDPAPLESGDLYYSAEDLYWLSRLINAESGNQSLDGKIGVGNVVLNRVADPTCPDSIYSVIFDNRYGVQFSVTETGGIYAEPNEESVAAAKMCLEGYDIVGNAIYFVNPELGISSWFTQTRTFVAAIGDHNFYA
jgi:N-acetylmuramoyl-L-alanine amidase